MYIKQRIGKRADYRMRTEEVVNMELMRAGAEQATAVLRVLANEDRLLLLCAISQEEMSVGELEEALDIHQPTLSQQLGVLRAEGLVDTRRDGKRIFYSIADVKVLTLLTTLYTLYCPKPKGKSRGH
jgi:ArsR family transcriptional regulator